MVIGLSQLGGDSTNGCRAALSAADAAVQALQASSLAAVTSAALGADVVFWLVDDGWRPKAILVITAAITANTNVAIDSSSLRLGRSLAPNSGVGGGYRAEAFAGAGS